MSILLLIVVSICICIAVALYFIESTTVKPSKFFYVFLSLTIVVWVSFITGLFTILPDTLANILWNSSWIGLFLLGIITFIYEIKRSISYAFSALIICLVNGGMYILAMFIASM